MANKELTKENIKEFVDTAVKDTITSTVKEVKESIENLPRTDYMTLPAIQITRIDEDAVARMEAVSRFNNATEADEVVTIDGKTKQQVINEIQFGVTNFEDTAGKHKITVSKNEAGEPVIKIQGAYDKADAAVEIVATPPNIAPVDANAPHNPAEAMEMEKATPTPEVGEDPKTETTSKVTGGTNASTPSPTGITDTSSSPSGSGGIPGSNTVSGGVPNNSGGTSGTGGTGSVG